MDLNQEDQQGQEEEEEEDHLMFPPSISAKYKRVAFVPPLPPPPPPREAINFMDLSSLDHHQQAVINRWPPDCEREHMFDKVVTPSDVGKLNRLVIPKQHAEKYFPLDSSSTEKGLLLNFVDRTGKPWRFRYSYWNSSQSYVMTKGWSRFVKEKKLDAGDIVSFQRGVGDLGRQHFYIDWRRRPPPPPPLPPPPPPPHHLYHYGQFGNCYNDVGWGGGGGGGGRLYSVLQRPTSMPVRLSSHEHFHHPYHHNHHQMMNQQYNLNHHNHHVIRDQYPVVIDSVPFVDHHDKSSMMSSSSSTSSGTSGGKRLRLFGVNMNIVNQEEEDFHQTVGVHNHDLHHQCQILPSTAIPFQHPHHLVPTSSISSTQLPNTMSTTPADQYLYSNYKGKSFYLDP